MRAIIYTVERIKYDYPCFEERHSYLTGYSQHYIHFGSSNRGDALVLDYDEASKLVETLNAMTPLLSDQVQMRIVS